MLQTAHGSLHTGLAIEPGQTLLIRGGTSSVGVAAAAIAKDHGLTVFSTSEIPNGQRCCATSVSITRLLTTAT
jgi:NADPH:quinone reductase